MFAGTLRTYSGFLQLHTNHSRRPGGEETLLWLLDFQPYRGGRLVPPKQNVPGLARYPVQLENPYAPSAPGCKQLAPGELAG